MNYETHLAPDGELWPYNCGTFSILIYHFDLQVSNNVLVVEVYQKNVLYLSVIFFNFYFFYGKLQTNPK